jgi:hypothetical protein
LDAQKTSCSMPYSTVTASPTSYGWLVKASVVTFGNSGTALFGVKKANPQIVPSDPLSSEILAGCR